MTFRLALVGRPNVGKSTLFNRLTGKKLAIVHDQPGVTRDWKEAPAHLGDLEFTAVDTAGLEKAAAKTIAHGMYKQTEAALKRADVILFMIDGREGVTGGDREIARLLRKTGLPVLLAANKCESKPAGAQEAFGLGFGTPLMISAEHGGGMSDLYDALCPFAGEEPEETEDEETPDEDLTENDSGEEEEDPDKPIRLAFIGRPNVGKSTLMNALLEEERSLVSPEAGTTRDAVVAHWDWQGQAFRLVDTAGLRKKAKIDEQLEKMAVAETLRMIRLAEIVVLVVDATAPLEHQDLALAALALAEGRAFVLALNKWDLVKEPSKTMSTVRGLIEDSLPQAGGLRAVPISALKRKKLDVLMQAILDAYKVWDTRVSTAPLNKWLEAMLADHAPPLVKGKRVKIRYMTQRKARPPTFVLFCGTHAAPPESYLRYLTNGLRQRFEMPAVPVRLEVRKGKNPFEDTKKKRQS